jgi:fumarate hydratase class I
VGDEVSLNGIMLTGRDEAHSWMINDKPDEIRDLLKDTVIYHCGPVVKKLNDEWHFVAAGPTTSIREEPFEGQVIKEYGIRGVMGKGGMGEKTLKALKENGSVYFVKKVHGVVRLEEFGVPEAMWIIEVDNFQAVVTMDSHGNSLHKGIKEASDKIANELIGI